MKRISMFLVLIMIFSIIPFGIYAQETFDASLTVKTQSQTIINGQKGVDYNTSFIDIVYGTSLTKNPTKDINTLDILVNGEVKSADFNFSVILSERKIRISFKDTNIKKLNEYSLYKIHIPQGFFIDGNKNESNELNFTFATKGNGAYPNDILNTVSYNNGVITFAFIDDIVLKDEPNIKNYITIASTPIDNLSIPNYVSDNISNYNVEVNKNQLILTSSTNSFKELSKYTINLKENALYLKNAQNILNLNETLTFTTDDIVENTYPTNGQENITLKPLISVNFKYPIDSNIDKSQISLISSTNTTHTNVQNYVYATLDGKSLKIDINSMYNDTGFLLSKNEEYTVKIGAGAVALKDYKNLQGALYKYNKDISFKFKTIKGKPEIISTYPGSDSSKLYDENSIYTKTIGDAKVYYITVVFKDVDGSINFYNDNKMPLEFKLFSEGSSENLVDETREMILDKNTSKETKLYIPIKEKLASGTKYTVYVPANIVEVLDENGLKLGNDEKSWSFTTNTDPIVTKVVVGSVPEDYDEDEPIALEGEMFYKDGIEVYFEDGTGDETRAEKVKIKDGKAYVYLPDGSKRLDVGVYTIIVENDSNHETEVTYGTLSVVKEGDYIPSEGLRVKDEVKEGEVVENVDVSEDTLILNSKYKDKSYLELDLDELMGEDTLVRKIKYEGSKSGIYSTLYTKSKYGDINIYNLSPIDYDKDKDIVVNLGRVEPLVLKTIKDKLKGANVVSDFIQVTGENFNFNKITIKMPFKSSGDNINVLRYDEKLRNWYAVPFTLDKVDKNVYIESKSKGIFVVID
ncbi:Ig-like domain-containing protein [Tepidibacter formicigenes]|uniref:Ig-like domain-containing protein n=1 Tax=Tepidibacter formicigenes DSM 15518 TaxID=1123349 RepID=A0A1M6QZK1_9FIRM|nr:Ig-like domain-containing protein [Tepidibacter formicigenes]SHK25528.1 Ig-like domain-containing protein [Tepidibacter formicigenes DSM 15518]